MSTNTSTESDSSEADNPYATSDNPVARGESLGFDQGDSAPSRPDSDRQKGRRDNWWGQPEVKTVADEHREHGTDWSDTEIANDKAESITYMILRGVAPKLCGVSIDDPAKTPTELTGPEVYPHGSGNREHLHRARVNDKEGYITGGESSGVRLGDIPAEDFFDVVEILLAFWQTAGHISSDDVAELMRDAKRMKQKSDIDDVEAVERMVSDVLTQQDEELWHRVRA